MRPIRILTIIGDLFLVNIAFFSAWYVRYEFGWPSPPVSYHTYDSYFNHQILLNALIVLTFWQGRVWKRRRGEFWVDEMGRIVSALGTAVALMIVYIFVQRFPAPFSRIFWVLTPLIIFLFLGFGRLVRRTLLTILYARGRRVDQVLMVGAGDSGRSLLRTLLARSDLGYRVVGYLADEVADTVTLPRIPRLGSPADLAFILQTNPDLHTVFIALEASQHRQITSLINICRIHGVRAQVIPDTYQLSLNQVETVNMGGIPLLSVRDVRVDWGARLLKRAVDLLIVLIGAIPAFLLGLLIAIAIKLDSRGPVFYIAERIGRNGRPFRMVKFRSMVVDADNQKEALAQMNEANGPIFKIRQDPRLTRVGRLIRRLSLDELPQVLNVLKGEMSLVGPRPPLKEEVAQYEAWHKQRLSVLGGITGLWQVSGRSDLTFDEQCLLDIYYIENWSLSLDLRILLQTIPYALFGRGAY